MEIVEAHGGREADAKCIRDMACDKRQRDGNTNVVVIASPTGFRRPNYLMALAAGLCRSHLSSIPQKLIKRLVGLVHLHPQWILDSTSAVNRDRPLSPEAYLLPSGSSVIHPFFVFRKQISQPQLLSQLRVLSFAGPVWNDILSAAGAILVSNKSSDVEKYRACMRKTDTASSSPSIGTFRGDGIVAMPDFIVIDSFAYSENSLDSEVLDLIEKCTARLNSRHAPVEQHATGWGGVPRVVSSEWVAHCLEIGEILDISMHPTFSIPADPMRSPFVIKLKNKETEIETRYVVGDTVFYEPSAVASGFSDSSAYCHQSRLRRLGLSKGRAPQESLLPGRIVSFSRKRRGDPMQVRMRPLQVACLHCGQNSSRSSPINPENHQYELSPSHLPDFLLASDKLSRHITVLASEMRGRLAYCSSDPTVYYSSAKWEHDMGYGLLAKDDEDGTGEPEIMIQHSQDY